MNKEQTVKLLKVLFIATLIMLLFEIIFSFDVINQWFAKIVTEAGSLVYIVIWLIMFAQVTILNIPAYVILSTCTTIGIQTLHWRYISCVLSAYMLGALFAYWLGYKFGSKAVKWCAGSDEDYNKWCKFINTKGKWFYFLTILFPLFPDDLLSIVCGSVHLNTSFYIIANFIGRGIGLIVMLLVLKLVGSIGSNFPYMIIVWALALIVELITMKIISKKLKENN